MKPLEDRSTHIFFYDRPQFYYNEEKNLITMYSFITTSYTKSYEYMFTCMSS